MKYRKWRSVRSIIGAILRGLPVFEVWREELAGMVFGTAMGI
jgi:hypothetical protein